MSGPAEPAVGGPAPSEEVLLPALPELRRLYAAGTLGTLRRRLGGRAPAAGLPTARHRFRDATIDVGRLTAFQRLVGAPVADVVHPGFVHIVAFPVAMSLMTRADFPLPLLGMVHLGNSVTQTRAVGIGDRLDVVARAENLRAHHSGTQLDLVAEVSVGGETVWRGTSTYLAKGTRLPGAEKPERDPRDFTAPEPTGLWRLPADTGRDYAAVSGDFNPIHLSAPSAKLLGFPRAIAHGMYLASRAFSGVPTAGLESFEWSVAFEAPALLPATVQVSTRANGGPGGGGEYTAWSARTGRRHFHGAVRPAGRG